MATSTKKPVKDGKKDKDDEEAEQARIRAVAMQHALNIEDKKQVQNKVLDTIIAAFDLPNDKSTDAAHPTAADANAFRDYLFFFRPSDLDEVVSERNIDNRCGYALCNNPNKSESSKIWDSKKGTIVDNGKWCSKDCRDRNTFVRRQLSTEPAWLRHRQSTYIRLLTDTSIPTADADTANALIQQEASRQEALATERGDKSTATLDDIPIIEKEPIAEPRPPSHVPEITVGDILEGLPIRTIGGEKRRPPR